jgi:uncharacterized protein
LSCNSDHPGNRMKETEELLDLIRSGRNDSLNLSLQDDPALAERKTDQGISLLQYAAYCRNEGAIKLLRKYKRELNLFEAASLGDADRVKEFVELDPDSVNHYSPDGFTPLGLASFFRQFDTALLLLDLNADPDIPSNNQMKVTPLHSACAVSDHEIAELLIRRKAGVNVRQMNGITPLHSAAHNGHTQLAELLISHGADMHARTDDGKTPLEMAVEQDHTQIAERIKSLQDNDTDHTGLRRSHRDTTGPRTDKV